MGGKLKQGRESPCRGGISTICLFHSWKVSRGVKRSRGSKADEDGFEVVPIEDPGKKFVHSGERSQWKSR